MTSYREEIMFLRKRARTSKGQYKSGDKSTPYKIY